MLKEEGAPCMSGQRPSSMQERQVGAGVTCAYNEILDGLGINAVAGDRSKDVGGADGDQVNALLIAKVPSSSLSLNLHSRRC